MVLLSPTHHPTEPEPATLAVSTLVVEDDPNILNLLSAYLERAGHAVTVTPDGKAGRDLALSGRFDLCVLDVMLPGVSGVEIARAMRDTAVQTPIVFLTARGAERDILRGFENGADDYLVKPFSPRELLVRIAAILRRSAPASQSGERVLQLGPVCIDTENLQCSVYGESVDLTPHEFRILHKLISQPNRVFERSVLIASLYGNAHAVSPKAVDVHVHHLRHKLGDTAGEVIQTVRGFGYRMVAGTPTAATP